MSWREGGITGVMAPAAKAKLEAAHRLQLVQHPDAMHTLPIG